MEFSFCYGNGLVINLRGVGQDRTAWIRVGRLTRNGKEAKRKILETWNLTVKL